MRLTDEVHSFSLLLKESVLLRCQVGPRRAIFATSFSDATHVLTIFADGITTKSARAGRLSQNPRNLWRFLFKQ